MEPTDCAHEPESALTEPGLTQSDSVRPSRELGAKVIGAREIGAAITLADDARNIPGMYEACKSYTRVVRGV
jgi:hypothetical protein